MGSKTQTSTSNQTTTPINTAALQNIYGAVANAAQTPYTAYSGQLTAPVNGQQYAGIQNINAASTLAQPYYSQAAGLVNSASNPLTNAQIQQYQNPYTQSVVNATQAQFNDQNAQQQNSLKGTAAQQGALGGDRQAVAQAQLAGQQQLAQAPTIANLYANSYNSGLQTAENQYQQNPLAAASSLAGIGSGAQNAALQGANAQVGAGSLLQNTEQAQDQAAYQQYQAAQAFPYQQAAYLQQYGLPAALAQGTTSSGAQTSPGPNLFSQIAGLGIAGVGLATNPGVQAGAAALPALIGLKDGGRVNGYAPGGSVGYITSPLGYIDSGQGYIPQTKASQNTLQAPSLKYANQPQATNTPLTGTGSLSSLANSLGANNSVTINPNGSIAGALGPTSVGGAPLVGMGAPADGLSLADTGGLYAAGGLVHAIHQIHKTIKQSRRYDDGGTVGDSFADRFSPAVSSPLTVMDDPRSVNPDDPIRLDPEATQRWRDSVDHPNAALVADQGMPGPDGSPTPPFSPTANVTAPPSNPMQATSLPPQITNPDGDQPEPSSALGYASNPMTLNASPATANPTPVEQPDASAPMTNAHHFALSDKASQALIAAGLGMLASRSPFFGVALGEGGLQGLKTYSEATKEEQEAADKKLTHDQEAQRLLLSIEANKRAAAQADLIQDAKGNWVPNPAKLAFAKQSADINTKDNWKLIPADETHPNDRLFNSATSEVKEVPPGKGGAVLTSLKAGQYDYTKDGPHVEKGDTVPEPVATSGHSADTLKSDAEYYLTTGVLPKASVSPRNPMGQQGVQYQRAVQNYATTLALSKGLTPDAIADVRRFGPQAVKFVLSQQGNQTVALGTSIRHLDSLKEYADAWAKSRGSDSPLLREAAAKFAKIWGSEEPTNLQAAARIAAPETIKAIGVAGAGTGGERIAQEEGFQPNASNSQILGAINVAQRFLAGQLPAKEAQANAIYFPHEKFVAMVGANEYNRLHELQGGKTDTTTGTGFPPDAVARPYLGEDPKFKGKIFYFDPKTKQLYPGQL